jgi:hypothetical protein
MINIPLVCVFLFNGIFEQKDPTGYSSKDAYSSKDSLYSAKSAFIIEELPNPLDRLEFPVIPPDLNIPKLVNPSPITEVDP